MKVVNKPIEMIAWFTDRGMVKPVKFCLQDEDHINQVIKIDRIVTQGEEKIAGNRMLIFRCQSIINGLEKIYELKYELGTCKWLLFKL
ncbi:MAG: hypothetical protein AAGU27_24355 [Dehalobacterium sp.]